MRVIEGGDFMKYEKSCGAVVFYIDSSMRYRFLLIHMNHGHYSFPKGHVESGEDEYMTARREIKEETGIDVDFLNGFREVVSYSPYPGVHKDVVFFLAKAKHTMIMIQEEELQSASFVFEEEVVKKLTFSTDRDVFNHALSFLKVYEVTHEECN